MSPEDLKAFARRVPQELLTQGDLATTEELFAPTCLHYAPIPLGTGADGAKQWATTLRRNVLDLRAMVDDEVAEGLTLVQRLTLTGMPRAPTLSIGLRNRPAIWSMISIFRISPDGQFTAHWSSWDHLNLLHQLGVIPVDLERPP